MNMFYIQLLTSFVVGGSLIAGISILAERVSKNVSGLILAFPSTVALSYFFLGWTIGPEAISKVVPTGFLPLGFALLFLVVYTGTAVALNKRIPSRAIQIIVTASISLLVWFGLSIPVAMYKYNSIAIGVPIYLAFLIFANFMMHRGEDRDAVVIKYTRRQIVGRAVFVGAIITVVVFLGKTMGAHWGSVMAMFPAASLSILVILHWYHGADCIQPFVKKFPVGTISMVVYSLVAMVMFPIVGIVFGTLLAYAASFMTTISIKKLQRRR